MNTWVAVVAIIVVAIIQYLVGFSHGVKHADRNRVHRGHNQKPKTNGEMVGVFIWCPDQNTYCIVGDDGSRLPLDGSMYPIEQHPRLAAALIDEYACYAAPRMGYFRVPDWTTPQTKEKMA